MRKLREVRDKLDPQWLADATQWALKSGAANEDSTWLDPLSSPSYGIEDSDRETFGALLNIARAIGWTRLDLTGGDIADSVYRVFDPDDRIGNCRAPTELAFRASAMLGRIDAAHLQGGADAVRALLTPKSIRQLLDALWGDVVLKAAMFEHRSATGDLAKELAIAGLELGGDFASQVTEAAIQAAQDFPVDFRYNGVWVVIDTTGDDARLRNWVHHWLGEDSDLWQMSRADIHSIAGQLTPLAVSIGETDLAGHVRDRLKWLLVGYRGHKEYAFEGALAWFRELSRRSASQSELAGWRLWCLCDACDAQDGDNRLRWDLRDDIAAAAMKCSASSWWRLISSTFDRKAENNWPDQTRQRLVDGAVLSIDGGGRFQPGEVDAIWSLGLALSRWNSGGDNASLRALRDCFRSSAKSEDARKAFDLTLSRTTRGASLDQTSADIGSATAEQSEATATTVSPKASEHATTEDEWHPIKSLIESLDDVESFIFYGVPSTLLTPALMHAVRAGTDALLAGLTQQLEMHRKWAYGGAKSPQSTWRPMPDPVLGIAWPEIAVKIIGMLLESHSVEVLVSALEGLHTLVNADPSLIPSILAQPSGTWRRHWLLSAAESWAACHSTAMSAVRPQLEHIAANGSLEERLQAWIVLCKHSDATKQARPAFNARDTQREGESGALSVGGLMFVPPTQIGHVSFIDRHAAAESILRKLLACGWDCYDLESQIQFRLARGLSQGNDMRESSIKCRGDAFCTRGDAEEAVGAAILSALTETTIAPERLPFLAQGFLGSDEAFMQTCAPRRSTASRWPDDGSYSGVPESPADDLAAQLRDIALSLDVTPGWRTFAARVYFCTSRRDNVFRLWWEEESNSLVIRPMHRPSCPSGRSFIWWLGGSFEPRTQGDRAVSAFFVGGHQRLHYCHFEIQPSEAWRTLAGWSIDASNPLLWRHKGQIVARYERLHGPLGDTPHGPHFRQPLVDRWLVTDSAFEQFELAVGALRMRDEFEQFIFKEE